MVEIIELPEFAFSGFEVYETEKSSESKNTDSSSVSDSNNSNKNTDNTIDSNSTDNNSDSQKQLQKLVAYNGEIKEKAFYDNMLENSFDEDYEGISNTGSASFPDLPDTKRFFKGKKICLKKANDTGEPLNWSDLESCLLGFITEQTFTTGSVDLKLVGMSKLLEQEKEFSFTQTKRSEILKQIIEAAGLKADIDVTGLDDDVTDYTNISSSGDSSGGYDGEVSAEIAEEANRICQGLTSCLDKAKAIWKYCHDNFTYVGYSGSVRGAVGCFKKRGGNCCDHANVVVQMLKSQNIKCAYEHSTSCYGGRGHVWAVAYCDGTWYKIDASVKSRKFNEVGQNCTGTRKDSLGF